jgi:hypothetical protein
VRRMLALLLLASAAAIPAAGCGDEELSPEAAVAEAATKTEETGSSRLSFTAEISGAGMPSPLKFGGEGEFDYEARQGRFTYELGELFGGGEGNFEVILDGLVMYMKFPPDMNVPVPGGKEWFKIDLAEVGKQSGIDFAALSQLNQGDPSQMLLYLRGASQEIEEMGEEEIRGEETTHYRARVDLEKAVEQSIGRVPEEMRESVRKTVDRLVEQIGARTIPVEVWIDGDGRARRMSMEFDMKIPAQSAKLHMSMTMDLFDFGVDVSAEPPPEGETVDLLELVGTAK